MQQQGTNLDFIALQVTDMEHSKHFYHELMGFALAEYQNPQATVFADKKGAIFAIKYASEDFPAHQQPGAGVSLWFGWEGSVDDLHQHLLDAGVTILAPPFDTPFGKSLTVADPDGYAITLHEIS